MLFVRGSYKLVAQAQSEEIFLDRGRSPQALIEAQQTLTGDLEAEDVAAVALTARTDDLTGAAVLTGQDLLVDAGCVSNPGTAWVNVSPSAFRQAETSPANGFRFWPEGGYLYSTSPTVMQLAAPVHLPEGASLTHIAKVFFDNETGTNSATNVVARLIRQRLSFPITPREQIAGFYSSVNSANQVLCTQQSVTATSSDDYSYFVVLEFPANAGIDLNQLEFGLRIYYNPAPTSSDPVIESVPVAAFRPNGNNANDSQLSYSTTITAIIRNTSTSTATLTAPLYPTNGVTLTQIRVSFRDISNPGHNAIVQLRRLKQNTGSVDILTEFSTDYFGDISANEAFIQITPNEIVSTDYSYFFTLALPPNPGDDFDVLIYGAKLVYTPTLISSQ